MALRITLGSTEALLKLDLQVQASGVLVKSITNPLFESSSIEERCQQLLNLPKESVPGQPVGTYASHDRKVSVEQVENPTHYLREVCWDKGTSGCVVAVFVKEGSTVVSNQLLLRTDRTSASPLTADAVQVHDSYVSGADLDGLMTTEHYASSAYPCSSAYSDAVAAHDVIFPIHWIGDPGVVVEVCKVGTVLHDGDLIVRVDTRPVHQREAYLHACDQLHWQIEDSAWMNSRWQELVEGMCSMKIENHQLLTRAEELEVFAQDFLESARMYGRVIISELHLPVSRKTIRPVNVGGHLGGTKYLVSGILFKIGSSNAESLFANYPDPLRIANKVQGAELKGLRSYFSWYFTRGLIGLVSFPLVRRARGYEQDSRSCSWR